jgi:hypothetical protein
VLVTISTSCENSANNKGCFFSYDAAGQGVTQTAGDAVSMAGGAAGVAATAQGASSAFLYTATGTGNVTFTPKFRVLANTGTFHYSTIIVQVFTP